jgi:lipid-A-disaccharide synthase
MKPRQIMLIAGEASGDLLASELVQSLRRVMTDATAINSPDLQPLRTGLEPRFFGAGGPRMKAAGVELAIDMTAHSIIGVFDVLRFYRKFRGFFKQLLALAIERQPDVIVGVDYGGFNLRFAHAVRKYVRARPGSFHGWQPRLVQYVSPQVWASRAGRVHRIAEDYDLVLSLFPFEKEWYAQRAPKLRVEFVGHPIVERLQKLEVSARPPETRQPHIVLLPGSRKSELYRHLPVILEAARRIAARNSAQWRMVLPHPALAYIVSKCLARLDPALASSVSAAAFEIGGELEAAQALANKFLPGLELQMGNLPEALAQADLAIASTGTVTIECACFGVPTVTLYKAAWRDYFIAKQIVKVKWLTMPNLLANEEIYPEFIQEAATAESIAGAALDLLRDESRRAEIKSRLAWIVASLGGPGSSRRAAEAIASLFAAGKRGAILA